ncbi:MAG: helix-turn-helix domain-containing protein [Treponema sp.]|nr:helix-turn-helix domain-containing protein [Treponema sp.]
MTQKQLYHRFSENFQKIRKQKNLTIGFIADECLMSRTEVSKFANGHKMLRGTSLCCVCEVLGIDPVELFKPIPEERRMMNK